MRITIYIALAAIMMLALCVGCGQGPNAPDPVVTEVNPLKGIQIDYNGVTHDLDAYAANLVGATVPELELVILRRKDRTSNAFSTNMTPDEIRQHIAASIVRDAFPMEPGSCTIEWGGVILTCQCWLYDHAGVYFTYPNDLIGFIGIHGIFVTQYSDAEIEALADAFYWMGFGFPPNGPPEASPCD